MKAISRPRGDWFYWWLLCELSVQCPVSLPAWPEDAGGSSGRILCLPAASAALAALLCFARINSKNIFQLNWFHPRWPSTLLVTLSLSQTTSRSILLSAVKCPPPSSQALHLTLMLESNLRRECCGPALCRKQLFNWHVFCVQLKDLMLKCFPVNLHFRGAKLMTTVIILQLPYPENNNGIVNGKQKQCKTYIDWSLISAKSPASQNFYYYSKQEEKPHWRVIKLFKTLVSCWISLSRRKIFWSLPQKKVCLAKIKDSQVAANSWQGP